MGLSPSALLRETDICNVAEPYERAYLAELCENRRPSVNPGQHVADRINAGLAVGEMPSSFMFAFLDHGQLRYKIPRWDITEDEALALFEVRPIPGDAHGRTQALVHVRRLWAAVFGDEPKDTHGRRHDAPAEWLARRLATYVSRLVEYNGMRVDSQRSADWAGLALLSRLRSEQASAMLTRAALLGPPERLPQLHEHRVGAPRPAAQPYPVVQERRCRVWVVATVACTSTLSRPLDPRPDQLAPHYRRATL